MSEPAISPTRHRAFCHLPFTKVILNGWGDVSMCCYQLTQLGHVRGGASVKDIWDGNLAESVRCLTQHNQLHPVCTSWNSCPYNVGERHEWDFDVNPKFAYPTTLEICLPNTHCNIGGEDPSPENPACIMCCRNYDMQKQPPITDMLCEKARPLMPHLTTFTVLGVAEPFWKDAVFRIFELVDFRQYRDRITFTTNTNGICLVERTAARFFDEVVRSEISFSLDAATPETYVKIRRADAYELVLRNLRTFMDLRDRNGGSDRHKVTIYNNINLLNVHEMVAMIEAAYDLGVGTVIMLPTHDQCGRVHMGEFLLNDKNEKVFARAADEAAKRAEHLGVVLHFYKEFKVPPKVGPQIIQIGGKA